MTSIPITQQGLDQLSSQLAHLNTTRRPQVVDRLSLARSMGDLSENSEYVSAKEELSFIDGQVAELEEMIKNAQVIVPAGTSNIGLGHTVTVQVNGTKVKFFIVGEWEADPVQKKISHSSPLGQALMGKKVGEQVEVSAPAGKILYTIVSIE